MPIDIDTIKGLAAQLAPDAIAFRRDLHQHPELGDAEYRTSSRVCEILASNEINPHTRPDQTGLTAEVGSGENTVGFRADLDALPIVETTPVPFKSSIEGVMHACGHDAHTAIATYAALLLQRLGIDAGKVRFIFQPAEEVYPGGAIGMVQDGLAHGLEGILAFHMDPTIPANTVGLVAGPITGSSDRFSVKVEGPGGHTARPHDTVDTISVAARIINDVPQLLRQQVDSRRPLVMVFGQISGGQTVNVIPTSVEMSGTCRTLDRDLWGELPGLVESLIHHVGDTLGAKVSVDYQHGIPPVINDPATIDVLRAVYTHAFGRESVRDSRASMGAEDFSRYLDRTPGALVRLGSGLFGQHTDLHSASFDMDESAIETGIAAAAIGTLALLDRINA